MEKYLSYHDDLIDNNLFFQLRWPQGQKLLPKIPSFSERKFLTFINANKYSYIDNELYSLRRQSIRYFDNQQNEFDIYGPGWNNNSIYNPRYLITSIISFKVNQYLKDAYDGIRHYHNYQGTVDDKYVTLSKYKYVLCFENEKGVNGYITEKIFDCFFAGAIPIYLGAKNIEKYIPPECFIDMRKFKDFPSLNDHLNQIDESEFIKYQDAGQKFIKSPDFDKWTPMGIFTEIINNF